MTKYVMYGLGLLMAATGAVVLLESGMAYFDWRFHAGVLPVALGGFIAGRSGA